MCLLLPYMLHTQTSILLAFTANSALVYVKPMQAVCSCQMHASNGSECGAHLVQGLNALHGCGRSHTDLKPGNIQVHNWDDPSSLQVTILDLGSSVVQGQYELMLLLWSQNYIMSLLGMCRAELEWDCNLQIIFVRHLLCCIYVQKNNQTAVPTSHVLRRVQRAGCCAVLC